MADRLTCVVTLIFFGVVACQRNALPYYDVKNTVDMLQARGHRVEADLGGAVRYLGFVAEPEPAFLGERVTLRHFWQVLRPLDKDYHVFVHLLVEGARGWLRNGDHVPQTPCSQWLPGTVVASEHSLQLPAHLPTDQLELRVGLYWDDERLPVSASHNDGENRIRAGFLSVNGTKIPLPEYAAQRFAAPPTLDGRFDEKEWRQAAWINQFTRSAGQGASNLATRAALGWDEKSLYLGFVTPDPDIQGTMKKRDDPIYREETVEIFIDPTGTGQNYVELQVNPLGTQFDAAFSGGPRRNMKVDYNAMWRAVVYLQGTVGDDRPDNGWNSEWAVDLQSIPGVHLPLATGTSWRINLFRVAKDRVEGRMQMDESAWSPPLMGDFHNPTRFGVLWFR